MRPHKLVMKKKYDTNMSFMLPFKEKTVIVDTAFKDLKMIETITMAPGSFTLS
jgi:hypothetical protein